MPISSSAFSALKRCIICTCFFLFYSLSFIYHTSLSNLVNSWKYSLSTIFLSIHIPSYKVFQCSLSVINLPSMTRLQLFQWNILIQTTNCPVVSLIFSKEKKRLSCGKYDWPGRMAKLKALNIENCQNVILIGPFVSIKALGKNSCLP